MSPIKTPACNFTFTAPAGADPGTVSDLHCCRGDGITVSGWEPTDEERAAIAMGGLVRFQVYGSGHPVVSLGTEVMVLEKGREVPKPDLMKAVALSCARAIETSGMHPSGIPVVIGTLVRGLASITGLPLPKAIAMCVQAARGMGTK